VLIDKGADRPQERVFCWYSHKLIRFCAINSTN
jgi:hypothetical protein